VNPGLPEASAVRWRKGPAALPASGRGSGGGKIVEKWWMKQQKLWHKRW